MSNNTRKSIVLSVKDKNLDPAQNTQFLTASFATSQLKDVFTSKNYSSITWNGNRAKENFDLANSVLLDFDHDITIEEAKKRLITRDLNYALVTTKRHTPGANRFRVLIPLTRQIRSAEDYERIIANLQERYFKELDPATMDAAHFFFGSPDTAEYSDCWTGKDYDPDDGLEGKVPDAWTPSLVVMKADGKQVVVGSLKVKTQILCPFHEDTSHSAFVDINAKKDRFIHCSACGKTFWCIEAPLSERCAPYWSHGTDVLEFGIAGDAFYMSSIGKDKFQIFVNALDKDRREIAFKHLLDHKHICHLKVVNHISDVGAEESRYDVDREEGIVTVRYTPVPVKTQDNPFIENYLQSTFGTHKDFIKQWLAVYCYTNYRDLPTLIFKGERGSGKNTFAEMVYSIFPTISQMWEAQRRSFSPEVEKKLLVADETVCDDPEQYKLLKQYAGGKHATVNKKYLPPYEVRNNMNIIILSNSAIPIYVARDEKPTSPENNQFFVYDFRPFEGAIDPEMDQKLEDRIGHYVRTELKNVIDGINFTGNRYSIKVPITPQEKGLFESNETEEESAAEKVIERILEKSQQPGFEYAKHLKDGFLPTAMLEDSFTITRLGTTKVVRALREHGYLEMTKAAKVERENIRRGCYAMTDKLKKELGVVRAAGNSDGKKGKTRGGTKSTTE